MADRSIGFVGLGIMDGPMAANLVKAGFDVVGFNRSRAKIDRLVAAGGTAAADVSEAIRNRDVVISMLPDSPDVEEFALGEAGVAIPLGSTAAQLMGALVAQSHGDLDNTALLRIVEELSGRQTD
jgi:3-hydroxyisobutyrate dehydrogenase-like beta-hydroxyacid dehydrogenase